MHSWVQPILSLLFLGTSCMAFFPNCSGFSVNGGHFTINFPPTQDPVDAIDELGKRHRRNSDGLQIVKRDEFDLHTELSSGHNYYMHVASHRGRSVVVKTFEGSRAKQNWRVDMDFYKALLHSNVLKIIGVSDASSKEYFALFHGIASEKKMQSLVAFALSPELPVNRGVQLSMKAVKGIAAGLHYIGSLGIVLHTGSTDNNRQWDNFDIFIGYDNEPVISCHPSDPIHEYETFDLRVDRRGIEVLNGLCQKLFSGANSILYRDSPERNFDEYDGDIGTAALEDIEENTSSLFQSYGETTSNHSQSTEKSRPSQTPRTSRREVWWVDLGLTNQSLESIKRCFEDCLDHCMLYPSNSPILRRIGSLKDNNLIQNLHQCPGYLREEITLSSDVSRSAIVSHAFPSQRELCSICGQLVQYTYFEPSVTNGYNPNFSSTSSPQKKKHRLSMVGLANPFIKMRRFEDEDRAIGTDVLELSSGDPKTHPNVAEGAKEQVKIRVEKTDHFVCAGGVNLTTLLRITRITLMEHVKRELSANSVVDEQWDCTISGPKPVRSRKYKVQVRYTASATRSSVPDCCRPVALDRAKGIPGFMVILNRNSS